MVKIHRKKKNKFKRTSTTRPQANPDNVCWHKDRQIKGTEESPELTYTDQLVSYQSANEAQWEKSIIFEQMEHMDIHTQ